VSTRAIVVGGGAIGVACAYYLSDAGFEVTILERGQVGHGCSYANAGLIVPGHSAAVPGPGVIAEGIRHLMRRDGPFTIRPRLDGELARWFLRFRRACTPEASRHATEALTGLSRLSLELYEDLVANGAAAFGFRRGPLVNAYMSEGWRPHAQAFADELQSLGVDATVVAGDALAEIEPSLGPEIRGGVVMGDQAWGDCFAYVSSLADALATRGVDVRSGTQAAEVIVLSGRAVGIAVSGVAREEIEGDLVVLAAGSWTPALTAPLGLRLPIQPATGYSATMPRWETAPRVPVILDEAHVAILPLEDRVRFAGTLELAGFRREPDPVRYQAVVRAGRAALRDTPPAEAEAWFGFRPLMPDDLPAIGWVPGVDGVLVAAGHGTLGFTQSPATGRLVAELVAGTTPSVPLGPFDPSRFAKV
jgi:D-amino-acid dehydrogenase